MNVPVVRVSGDPYSMGVEHGKAMAGQIASYAAERLVLAGSSDWTGRESSPAQLLALASACLEAHEAFSPHLVEELAGVAAGAGVYIEQLLIAGGFTDFVDAVAAGRDGPAGGRLARETDDCTAFLVPASRLEATGGALAQTWDMHEGSAEHLVLLEGRPRHAPAFTVYTTAGCLGMIGMNEAGVSVGINNLLAADGRAGVTWPFVVRAMLEQESTAAALDVLFRAPLAGGHSYLVMDASGAGACVEAMPTRLHAVALEDLPVVHTNHCLHPSTRAVEREREPASQANSEARLADAQRLLDRERLSVRDLMSVTADQASICRVGVAPSFVGTCGAVVMLPATRELWVVGGRPSEGTYQLHAGLAAPV